VTTVPKYSASPGIWEERTGWSRLKAQLLLEPLPGGARWAAAFGSLLLFAFIVQIVTGILLAMNYAPSEKTAWASVKFIQEEVPLGGYIRALHHWGSSAMVILLLVHLVQVFVWGAYKRPREFTWMVGVLLLVCTLGLAFTGYLLPWDQKAYWATKVGLGIASTVPVVGDGLRTLLQGGTQMGNLTLTRFYTIHGFVLPGLMVVLVVMHLYFFRQHGVTPAWWQSPAELKIKEETFWPGQAWKDGVFAALYLGGLGAWCCYRLAPLEGQADPAQPYEARPEWYFMFLFEILRYFRGSYEIVGTFVLPTLFLLVLFFWPFLDRNPQRDPRRRPLAMSLMTAGTVGLVGLTIFAVQADVRMHEPAMAAPKAPPAEPAGAIQQVEVAQLYGTNCAACHGVDGTGKQIRSGMPTIPDFTSLAWQMSQTDLEITHRIVDGNEPLMPAFRDKLTDRQNLALAIYVRAFAIEHAAGAPANAARAAARTRPEEPAPKEAQPAPRAGPSPAFAVSAQMTPVQIYRAYCLACHDGDGRGSLVRKAMPDIPDFTSDQWQASRGNTELGRSILEGKGNFMLPMKDKLGTADAGAMIAYIREFGRGKQVVKAELKQPASIPTPAPSKEPRRPDACLLMAERTREASVLFRQFCLTCHGTNGRGAELRASMPSVPDFGLAAWQTSRNNSEMMVSILEGKGTLMPAFRGRVSEEQVHDLIAYVRAFGPVSAPVPETPASDFEQRFRQLQDQWQRLHRELEAISPKPPKS
jgi:quinol-cytochrome oxidoreductase complex cytochrome b subunit/cytochrome c